MLESFWDWMKRKTPASRGRKTVSVSRDKTPARPVAPGGVTPGTADTHIYTPDQAIQAAQAARTQAVPLTTMQQIMQQLGPDDKMTQTQNGYYVTTKPVVPPRRDLPADIFGTQEDGEGPAESFKSWLKS